MIDKHEMPRRYQINDIVKRFLKDVCPILGLSSKWNNCFVLVPTARLKSAIQALDGRVFQKQGDPATYSLHADEYSSNDWKAPKNVGWKQNMAHEIGRRLNGEARWVDNSAYSSWSGYK